MRKPDFFLVGAPKCGTSALWKYLRAHPSVVVGTVKEPHYFATDLPSYRAVTDEAAYLALFEGITDATLAVGEASVFHLYSYTAIPNIRRFNPDARLIAMVRNPIEVAYSFHMQMQFSREETEPFPRALELQAERRRGRHIPRLAREPALLQYTQVAMLGRQIERMLSVFPREQVKVLVYDDFRERTAEIYEEVLRFLAVPSDGRTEFPVHNASKAHRIGWVGTIAQKPPRLINMAARALKTVTGIEQLGIMKRVRDMNRVDKKREPLPPSLHAELADLFRDDVAKLGSLLGRDLGGWLSPPRPGAFSGMADAG